MVDRSLRQDRLTAYANLHRNWLARLEGKRASTSLAPLIALELDAGELVVQLGSERYRLRDPLRIVELTGERGDRGLRIELAGRSVFLRFRVAAKPEMIGASSPPDQSPKG